MQLIGDNGANFGQLPTNSTVNYEFMFAGAGLFGTIGAILGGLIGAFMPKNTVFTWDSIVGGLQSEYATINSLLSTFSGSGGLPAGLGPLFGTKVLDAPSGADGSAAKASPAPAAPAAQVSPQPSNSLQRPGN